MMNSFLTRNSYKTFTNISQSTDWKRNDIDM